MAKQISNYNEWLNLSVGDYLDANVNKSMDEVLQNGASKPTELNFQGNLLADNGDVMTSFIDDGRT